MVENFILFLTLLVVGTLVFWFDFKNLWSTRKKYLVALYLAALVGAFLAIIRWSCFSFFDLIIVLVLVYVAVRHK